MEIKGVVTVLSGLSFSYLLKEGLELEQELLSFLILTSWVDCFAFSKQLVTYADEM